MSRYGTENSEILLTSWIHKSDYQMSHFSGTGASVFWDPLTDTVCIQTLETWTDLWHALFSFGLWISKVGHN